ncbi:uncharacterized protein LOC126843985 isoform X2 [Adelges cooleyi]|uniref:uncharacterized protein LOC126843985 isoform X2 n=1 Tax=Adelges cooleyi TaxID=133065 RepID=UPI00217F4CF2|nr:uncharacterized protein LOC126843985 isoform X2 [Adelges cooleyi]
MFLKKIILLLCVLGRIEKSISTEGETISDTVDEASTSGTSTVRSNTAVSKKASTYGPHVVNINPNLKKLTNKEWKAIFDKYDIEKKGSISATILQKLLYNEFKVFITIRHAQCYTNEINDHKSSEIGWKVVKKMKPIITVLSQRESLEEYTNLIKSENTSCENFVVTIRSKFEKVFENENEVLEVLKVVGHDEKLPINSADYHEILKMLTASLRTSRGRQSTGERDTSNIEPDP